MPTNEQLRIRDFIKEIKRTIDSYRVCTVTREIIREVFFDKIIHDRMYFPMPGDPEPSDPFTDFQRCMKQNGLIIINHQGCDGQDRLVDVMKESK